MPDDARREKGRTLLQHAGRDARASGGFPARPLTGAPRRGIIQPGPPVFCAAARRVRRNRKDHA